MKLRIALACCFSVLLSPGVSGTPASADASADSARSFVAAFYAWYVPKVLSRDGGDASDIALSQKHADFSAPLLKALQEDAAAAAKSPDEIVGLDFDPYVNSQDPCDHYAVGAVTHVGDSYKVGVFGSCSKDELKGKPDVIAVVAPQDKSWVFTNFIYPAQGDQPESDLLVILKNLKQDREKLPKQP